MKTHTKNLDQLKKDLQKEFSRDLLKDTYQKNWSEENPTYGFCSVATEAAWFCLGGKASGWMPYVGRDEAGGTHWWLTHKDGRVFDPTEEQYISQGKTPPYNTGKPCFFMGARLDPSNTWGTGYKPSKRAEKLLTKMQKSRQIQKLSSTLFSANDLILALKDKDLATLDFLSKNRPLRLTDQMLENVVFDCKDTETLNLVHGYFSLPDKFWIDRLVYSLKRCHGKDHEEIIRYIKENHAHVFSNDHLGRCLTPHLFSVAFNYPERTQILKCHLKDIIPHMSKSSREEFFTGFSLTDHADLCDMIKDVDPENILRILGEISLDTNRGEALSRVQALKAKMSQQHLLDQTSVPERKKASRKI